MEVQSQRKNHSGYEVHLCPKCGWPYPNPHPSAKHRRAHHRVCGTIEGYKSGVVPDSHSNVPLDEDDHSDDEQHPNHSTTGSNVLERNLDEGGSKDITGKPDVLIEEAFLDAVTHFPEAGPTPLHEESSFTVGETVDAPDKNTSIVLDGLEAHKDATTSAEIGQTTLDSSYTSVQNLLEPKIASQEWGDTEIRGPSICSAEQEEAKILEAPNDFLDLSHVVAALSSLDVGSETNMDSSVKASISADSKIVNKQLAYDSVKEGDIIANEQTRPVSLLSRDGDDIFATEPSEEFTSVEDGKIKTISTGHQPENPDAVSHGNLHVENLNEGKDFQTYVLPKDIPVTEQPEMLIEGHIDSSVPKFHLAEDLATPDTILQKEDSSVLVSEDSSVSEIKLQKELSDVHSTDHILLKDIPDPEGDLKEQKEYAPTILEGGGNACKSEKLEAETIDQDLSIQNLPVESSLCVSQEIKATQIPHASGENNLSESHVKQGAIIPEILAQENEVQEKSMTNVTEVERASDIETPETEWAVVTEVETGKSYFERNGNLKETTAEYAVEYVQLDGVSAHDTESVSKDVEFSEEKGELSVVDVETTPESTVKYQVDKEAVHVQSSDTVSPIQGSVAVENNQSRDPRLTTPKIPIDDEYVDNFFKTEPVVSAPDRSVDPNSRTDSLEANWGSISVLSTQSDPSVTTENELLTPAHDASPTELGELVTEAEGKGSGKTDVFEAPSFLTLVEPRVGTNQTDGALAQKEDKKNEGITPNQGGNTGKHHSALKNLLVEATQEIKLKSSSQKDTFASGQKDETAAVTTVGKILGADDRKSGGSVKEWDSPARYPADIKKENRKVKGHWMPFICCSSVK